jgi:hypothetical protein
MEENLAQNIVTSEWICWEIKAKDEDVGFPLYIYNSEKNKFKIIFGSF